MLHGAYPAAHSGRGLAAPARAWQSPESMMTPLRSSGKRTKAKGKLADLLTLEGSKMVYHPTPMVLSCYDFLLLYVPDKMLG
eukprot:5014418-Amphidinium_carterae.1